MDDFTSQSKIASAASWVTLVLAFACLSYIAFYIPVDRRHYIGLFNDFELQVSRSTAFMLAIPDFVFPAVALTIAFTAVAIQWFARRRFVAAMCHMIIVMVCVLIVIAYRETTIYPLSALIESLQQVP